MRKITIKDWPFPEKTKTMLLRVDNPFTLETATGILMSYLEALTRKTKK